MASWRLYDLETGAQIGELLADEPTPAQGQGVWRVTGSEKSGAAVWSPALRGAVEVPVLTPQGIWNLFTGDEKMAICLSEIPEVSALVKALPFAKPTRPTDPWHQQGVALLAGLNLLTPERAAQVLAFQPPAPEE